ncbi:MULTISPECIES: LysR family transcriptional regulator [Micrococcales]|uniref:DNA-binding transcriptional LysR family regulator n=2 Tax=Micrococcales TaxID=85006 RepID=A0AAW8NFF4_PSEOX|nr:MULTISPECIES: LysR substrate-binding domain-containing protein [Micrococcales]MDJ1370188.1 LysR family transcriptional regulator [Gulosibacter molinativorax]MDR7165624.1 DNA-binding transcriptional LysR family regulator [Pseudarthrobacter oxydans]QUY61599.1 HTH-type transcriptional regulator CatM [Gulosibacter molinativorax]
MEIQDLRAFVAVAEELHFGRAADRLHLAQPPVSRTIKALEKELGAELFRRTTRSVEITAAGEALLGPARRILSDLQHAAHDVHAAQSGELGRVSIAFAGASTQVLVGQLSRASRQRYPKLTIELSSQNFAQPAINRLLNDEADISIGRWDFVPEGIMSRVLLNEQLVVAVPATHPLAGSDSVRMDQLSTSYFVTLPAHPGSVLTDRLLRLSHAAGFDPLIAQVAPDTWTALSLVAAEVGIHLTISSVAENTHTSGFSFLPVADPFEKVLLRMAWRSDSRNPALSTVLSLAAEVL